MLVDIQIRFVCSRALYIKKPVLKMLVVGEQ